jgi:hypothetical protein
MEFLHLDVWTDGGVTPDVRLISVGAEIPHPISNGDGSWQSIDIPIAGITEDIMAAIQLKFDGGDGMGNAIYVDNIYFWKSPTTVGGPPIAAPNPPARDAVDVISLFSDEYTDIVVDTFDTPWCPGVTTEILVDSNPTKRVEGLGCEGVEFVTGRFDATEFTHFHMDIYTDTDTADKSFNIKFSNWNGGTGEANSVEYSVNNSNFLPNPNPGTWISLDIPLSSFSGGDRNDFVQFVITSDLGTVYYDNLYLWKEPTLPGSDATLSDLQVDGATVDGFSSSITQYDIGLPLGTTVIPQITVATPTDVNATSVTITQASILPGDATVVVVSQNGTETETYTVSFALGLAGPPMVDPPTPPAREAADVISVFSAAYTNIPGVNLNPNWGQTGFGSADTAYDTGSGNLILAYTNFNYQGVDFNGVQDVSGMEFLHVDIWTDGGVAPNVFVISSGTEIPNPIPNVAGSWQSLDLPIAGITMDPTGAIQFKFDGGDGTTSAIYVDNLYFWKSPTAVGTDATLSDLQVDGATIAGFSPTVTQYNIGLPAGTPTVPQITLATPTDVNVTSVTITQAPAFPGDATVIVVSQDATVTETYTVSFAIEGPPSAAPTPPARAPADVVSLFSDVYADIIIDTYDTPWCAGTTTEVLVDTNPTKRVDGLGCEGVEFITGRFDATAFTHFHMDIYTDTDTADKSFNIKFSNWNGGAGEANALEFSVNNSNFLTNPNPGTWISLDIPFDDFNNIINGDKNDFVQFIISSDLGTVYYDNLYLWKEPSIDGSDATLSDLQVDGTTVTGFNPAITEYNIDLPAGTTVIPQITLATPTDANVTSVTITQASVLPGDATVDVVSQNGTVTETYTVSFAIVLGPPTVAAPTPPARDVDDVISIYSDAYTNISVDSFDTPWCPGTTEEILIDSNPTRLVSGLGCEGVEFISGRFDATTFTHFHMDIYTEIETLDKNFNVKLSNWNGGSGEVNALQFSADNSNFLTTPNPGTWISLDILLDDFNTINNGDRNDIVQFIMSSDLGEVYYDNLYIYRDPLAVGEFNAADFKVYPNPTSGSWTISSNSIINNVVVYDILGSQVFAGTPNQQNVDINASALNTGMYFARIESEKGTKTVKLIKK